MSEELKPVVNEEGSQPTADTTTAGTEQVPTASEGVKNTGTDGKDYKVLYENARKAIQEKNRTIQELKRPESTQDDEGVATDDDGVKRFLRTEADAYLTKKAMLDPVFKDLVPAIEALVEQGVDVRTAEQRVKAQMFESMSTQIAKASEETPLTQIKPGAVPETAPIQDIGIKEILEGKVDVTPEERALVEAISRMSL